MNEPIVSIIIPMYNSQATINKCIDSIKKQTYKNLEVILIDDGSKDDTLNESIKSTKNDNRFFIISQMNSGASSARNEGIIKSTGDYMMFVDSDDYIDKNMVETLVDSAREKDADYVVCGMITETKKEQTKTISIKHELTPQFIDKNIEIPDNILNLVENEKINGPYCKLIKSRIVKDNNILMPRHIALQEDLFFNIQVLIYVKSFMVIEQTPYHYILGNDKSVTMGYYHNKYEMLDEVHDLLLNFYKERSKNEKNLSRIKYIYIKNLYASILNLFHKNCNMNKKEKLEYINEIIKGDKFQSMIKQGKRKGFKYFILKYILKTKSKKVIYYTSKVIHYVKTKTKYGYS